MENGASGFGHLLLLLLILLDSHGAPTVCLVEERVLCASKAVSAAALIGY